MKWNVVGIPAELEPGTYNIKVDRISLPRNDSPGEPVVHAHLVNTPKDNLSSIRALLAEATNGDLEGFNWPVATVAIGLGILDQLVEICTAIKMLDRDVQGLRETRNPFDT
jgi:hypothetical protein